MRTLFMTLLALLFGSSAPADTSWWGHPRWDDGLAEVAVYDGQMEKYGKLYPATLEVVTVRESFSPERLVKAMPGEDGVPVLKMNMTRRVRTGVYEYVQMASTFHHRKDGTLLKISTVSSEWCGNSSTLFQRGPEGGTLRISSYFDGTGYSEHKLAEQDVPLFREELIAYLRSRTDGLQPGARVELADALLSHKPRYGLGQATVRDVAERTVEWGDQRVAATSVTLALGDGEETFMFLDDDLRTFFRWENDRGEFLALRKSLFLDYWNRNRPGDERLLG